MLDHMSSTGVMHGDGRRRGEERVIHERKKENIAAVHTWYRTRLEVLLDGRCNAQQYGSHCLLVTLGPFREVGMVSAVILGRRRNNISVCVSPKANGHEVSLHGLRP
jgi:hypothetical protein